jgi:hypothetical protein
MERLRMFEFWYSKDPIFFSFFPEYLTYEYRMEFGQSGFLKLENLSLLGKNELSSRLYFLINLEKYGTILPMELKNLIYNCEEIINLRRHLISNPLSLGELKDNLPEELFEKLSN